ncbi:MAG TPA: cytochrome P450 [Reyranella sp.]|nr:cytochrome P450 [Reyranella sp.]
MTFGTGHLLSIRRNQLAFYFEMQARYGDAVPLRLGPYRSWLLFAPDLVEQVLTRRWQSFVRFEKLMRVISQWTGDNMLVSEGQEWHERRRKLLPAFKLARLPGYGEKAVGNAVAFCDALDRKADADGSVAFDTDAAMARLTLDIALATLFDAPSPGNGEEIERTIQILSETAFRESTSPLTLPDWLPLPAKRRKRHAMEVMDRLVTGLVRDRLADAGADRGDLLSILVAEHQRREQAIRDDAMSLLIAGHETSGALLSWTFYCLAASPEWYGQLTQEIETVLKGRLPTAGALTAMPMLRAVIEEVLRLYPPAYALFLRRAVEDVDLGSFTIAKGDLVQITPFVMHRDARWFAHPSRFDPSRFLTERAWPRYAYLPFGSGPRVCIGQSFGLMEACLIVATILQRWRPSAARGPVVPEARFSLRPRGGLPMTWEKNG